MAQVVVFGSIVLRLLELAFCGRPQFSDERLAATLGTDALEPSGRVSVRATGAFVKEASKPSMLQQKQVAHAGAPLQPAYTDDQLAALKLVDPAKAEKYEAEKYEAEKYEKAEKAQQDALDQIALSKTPEVAAGAPANEALPSQAEAAVPNPVLSANDGASPHAAPAPSAAAAAPIAAAPTQEAPLKVSMPSGQSQAAMIMQRRAAKLEAEAALANPALSANSGTSAGAAPAALASAAAPVAAAPTLEAPSATSMPSGQSRAAALRRKERLAKLEALAAKRAKEEQAATKLQSTFRGNQARQLVQPMKAAADAAAAQKAAQEEAQIALYSARGAEEAKKRGLEAAQVATPFKGLHTMLMDKAVTTLTSGTKQERQEITQKTDTLKEAAEVHLQEEEQAAAAHTVAASEYAKAQNRAVAANQAAATAKADVTKAAPAQQNMAQQIADKFQKDADQYKREELAAKSSSDEAALHLTGTAKEAAMANADAAAWTTATRRGEAAVKLQARVRGNTDRRFVKMKRNGYRMDLDTKADKDNRPAAAEEAALPTKETQNLDRITGKAHPYDPIRDKLREQEKIVFSNEFDINGFRAAGSDAFEKNQKFHKELTNYTESLFKMSGGAHAVTKSTLEFHSGHRKRLADEQIKAADIHAAAGTAVATPPVLVDEKDNPISTVDGGSLPPAPSPDDFAGD